MWYLGACKKTAQNIPAFPKTEDEWDDAVRMKNQIGAPKDKALQSLDTTEGPGVMGTQIRRLSPHHSNPEETTWEEQLDTLRQQNINRDPVQQTLPNPVSEMQLKGPSGELPRYNTGKGWIGFQDNKSSTQTFAE